MWKFISSSFVALVLLATTAIGYAEPVPIGTYTTGIVPVNISPTSLGLIEPASLHQQAVSADNERDVSSLKSIISDPTWVQIDTAQYAHVKVILIDISWNNDNEQLDKVANNYRSLNDKPGFKKSNIPIVTSVIT